ncbi:MAG: hypothetical protein HYV32_01015 [Candidatus Kerfeldbacteria bacterium]|nr:hypothetical protein [Candidatus Kerfeldbacteria bacterium]
MIAHVLYSTRYMMLNFAPQWQHVRHNRHRFSGILLLLMAVFLFFTRITPVDAAKKTTHKDTEAKTPTYKYVSVPNVEEVNINFDRATIQKGYSIQGPSQEVTLGVPGGSLTEYDTVHINIRALKKKFLPLDNEQSLSRVYAYSITEPHGEKVDVSQPLWLSLLAKKESKKGYTIKLWNAKIGEWETIPTTFNESANRFNTTLSKRHAIVGVFAKPYVEFSGKASWYDWYGAAMNDLPIGTRILVINPNNGKQATTTVVSTGPYVANRIIDLPRDIFSQLGELSSGVMDVVVRKID